MIRNNIPKSLWIINSKKKKHPIMLKPNTSSLTNHDAQYLPKIKPTIDHYLQNVNLILNHDKKFQLTALLAGVETKPFSW